jgi:hypothetical protein
MQDASGGYILDETVINNNINLSNTKFNKAINNLTQIKTEIINCSQADFTEIKMLAKEYRTYLRYYQTNGNFSQAETIKNKLIAWCNETINIIDSLKSLQKSGEAQVIYFRFKADYLRYLAELCPENKNKYIQEALVLYNEGMIVSTSLPIHNVNKLQLVLNYTVLLSDEMLNVEKAIEICTEITNNIKNYYESANCNNKENLEDVKIIADLIEQNLRYYVENKDEYINQRNSIKYTP